MKNTLNTSGIGACPFRADTGKYLVLLTYEILFILNREAKPAYARCSQ